MKQYSFKDIDGIVPDTACIGVSMAQPITLSFTYRDTDGVLWHVEAEGTRTKATPKEPIAKR